MVVVTDPHHMPRALHCFRRFGVAAQGAAVPDTFAGVPWPKVALGGARRPPFFGTFR